MKSIGYERMKRMIDVSADHYTFLPTIEELWGCIEPVEVESRFDANCPKCGGSGWQPMVNGKRVNLDQAVNSEGPSNVARCLCAKKPAAVSA
jgi:hypothetical protein